MYIIARKCQNSIEPRKTYLCVSVYDYTLHVNNKLIMIKTSIIIAILTQTEFLLPIKHKHYIGILRLISRMYTGLKNIHFTFCCIMGKKLAAIPERYTQIVKVMGIRIPFSVAISLHSQTEFQQYLCSHSWWICWKVVFWIFNKPHRCVTCKHFITRKYTILRSKPWNMSYLFESTIKTWS